MEATLDHNTRIDAATTEAAHNDLTPPIEATAINIAATHHSSSTHRSSSGYQSQRSQ